MKSQTESLEHASVRQYCKAVRMPAIGAHFLSLAEQAVKENHSHIRYLEALLAMECEERDRHAGYVADGSICGQDVGTLAVHLILCFAPGRVERAFSRSLSHHYVRC
jgi:hypothetical protein